MVDFTYQRGYQRQTAAARDAFLSAASEDTTLSSLSELGGIRPIVRESWARSRASGVNPDAALVPVELLDLDLREYRDKHPLAKVMNVIRTLLTASAADANYAVAVTDSSSRFLWVEGDPKLVSNAENIHFVEGARWDESVAGTNAPGLALLLDRPVRLFRTEHFSRNVHAWSCSAAPIHDPVSGRLLGAVDITGRDHVASVQAMALVRATAAAAQAELKLLDVTGGSPGHAHDEGDPGRLEVLGRDTALFFRAGEVIRLSRRHSELLLLLMNHPNGLSTEQLAIELYEHDLALVTVRAEMSRLRRLLGESVILSQPYRVAPTIACDATEVRSLLRRGAVAEALDSYRGPVLPHSEAPGVISLRDSLQMEMRYAVLDSNDANVVVKMTESEIGRDDLEIFELALELAGPRSPYRAHLRARVASLRHESLGIG